MPTNKAPLVAAIIVNYHKAARVAQGLKSLRAQSVAARIRICAIDNSVCVKEAEQLRDAVLPSEMLLIPPRNLGYASAINLGVRNAGNCDYVLLVNPDIILDSPESVETMLTLMQANPDIGVLATLQRNDDGSSVEVSRRFPSLWRQLARRIFPSRYSDIHLMDAVRKNKMTDTDWVQSSFVMIPKPFWDAVGGLDERYYVFMSDVEICRRAHEAGLRVAVTSAVSVRADGVRASRGGLRTVLRNKALRIHMRDAAIYYLRRSMVRRG